MANFAEIFKLYTGNFFVSAQNGFSQCRNWYRYSGHLVTDSVANKPGFILVKTPPELNGGLSARYKSLDKYNGGDNFIILRFRNPTDFLGIRINPGTLDEKGIYISHSNTNKWINESVAISEGDTKLNLIRGDGLPVSAETYPNNITLPTDGIVTVDISNNNTYNIKLWNTDYSSMIVSAQYIDNNYTLSGHIGFFHTEKYDANIFGWDYIIWNDTEKLAKINAFSVISPISSNSNSELSWETSGCTSAYISGFRGRINGILPPVYDVGWINPVSAGTFTVTEMTHDELYILSAFDINNNVVTASAQLEVIGNS